MTTELDGASSAALSALRTRRTGLRVLTIVLVVVLVAASAVGVGWAIVRHQRGLEFAAFTDRNEYAPGEDIHVWVRFTNYGFDSVTLTSGTSIRALFAVYTSAGDPVCSVPAIALEVITESTLEPGDHLVYGVRWDQLVVDEAHPYGQQLEHPGSYFVVARATTEEFGGTARTAAFTVSA